MLRFPLFAIGAMLVGLAAAMCLPLAVNVFAGHADTRAFALSAAATAFLGAALMLATRRPGGVEEISRRAAFVLTAGAWLVLPAFAALPIWFGHSGLDISDAIFESVSGITTTGSTVLSDVEAQSPGLLIWRSLLQWIGGVGIIVMAVIMLPFLRVGGMQLFQLESSQTGSDRVIPRAFPLIASIMAIYGGLTAACTLAYGVGGMTLFEAVNHAMTTVSTGGFSTRNLSLGDFSSPFIDWSAVVFMIAGAMPFLAYIRALRGRLSQVAHDAQVQGFAVMLALICLGGAAFMWATTDRSIADSLTAVTTNAVSVVTTTGYATEDYSLWGPAFVGFFFALTFLGGCAGSTSGAIKVYRFQILFTLAREKLRDLYEPNAVRDRVYAGKPITNELAEAVLAFLAFFIGALSVGAFALTLTGLDLETALTGAATALCNVGPGLGPIIGPVGNFSTVPDAAKWVLIGLMILGRLELFALLVLFDPRFWRR